MAARKADIFDEIEEDFRNDCYYTDSDNLYLFGNLFCSDELVNSDLVQDELCSNSTKFEGDF